MSKAVKNLARQARGVVEQIHEIEMGESQPKNQRDHVSDLLDTGYLTALLLVWTVGLSLDRVRSRDRFYNPFPRFRAFFASQRGDGDAPVLATKRSC